MGRASHTPNSSIIVMLESRIEALEADLRLSESLYKVAVAERNYERMRYDNLLERVKEPSK